MSVRPWVVAATTLILGGVTAYLLLEEYRWHEVYHGIAPSEFMASHVARKEDPLIALKYGKGNRDANMDAFGLPEPMKKKVLDRMRDLEDREGQRLVLFLSEADQPTELADAVCGQTNQVRPRYGALRFLVQEDKGQRRAINLARESGLKRQDWSQRSPISEVYLHAELAEERKPDATLMALAAIFLGKEEDLLNDYKPWGRGFANTWSWDLVKKQNPGIEDILVNYFALMHLTVELATGEDGICGQ